MNEEDFHDNLYNIEAINIFYSPMMEEMQKRIFNFLKENSGMTRNKVLLSFGCGIGKIERKIAPFFKKIIAIDLSEVAIDIANNLCKKENITNINFMIGDVCKVKLNKPVDVIIALGFLHHLSEQEIVNLAHKSFSMLKPGGFFYSVDPYKYRFANIFKFLFIFYYQKYHSSEERELDYKDIVDVFKRANFDKITIQFLDFFLGPLAWSFHSCPDSFVELISKIDNFLLSVPLLKEMGSSFCIIAKK